MHPTLATDQRAHRRSGSGGVRKNDGVPSVYQNITSSKFHLLSAVVFVALASAPCRAQLNSETNAAGGARDYHFAGSISRPVLESYLSRSMTMLDLLTGRGNLADNIRMMTNCGVKFAGRTIYLWGEESSLEKKIAAARAIVPKVRQADPDIILQACIFEIVSKQVSTVPVPEQVFQEFGVPVEKRSFDYEAMLYPDGRQVNHWYKEASVPDITRLETRMWFFYLATRYLDLGCEAIHFGQVELIGRNDKGYANWWDVLARVRNYAKVHAGRGMVLCDAHAPKGGPRLNDSRLLFDFHSFPARIKEVPTHPQQAVLKVGYLDSLYGRSKGGVTPSGWRCGHLPYLVELDNWGRSGREGQNISGIWVWGYDEISWFAHQSKNDRASWLRYAWDWVRRTDTNGFFQMPGSRILASPVDGKSWYSANNPNSSVPDGFGDEAVIHSIWSANAANKAAETHL